MGICQRSCCTVTKLSTVDNDGKGRNPSKECIWSLHQFLQTKVQTQMNTNESVEEELNEGEDDVEESEDEIPDYKSESDVEATSGEENDEGHKDSVTNVAAFLAGTSSRFRRSIKLNKKSVA